jgi:hypothetical protein
MLTECFIIRCGQPIAKQFLEDGVYESIPSVRLAAVVSLLIASLVGTLTSGVIPGLESWQVGICSLQSWLVAFATYFALRKWQIACQSSEEGKSVQNMVPVPIESQVQEIEGE